jgi:hypothetical protein
MDMIRRILKMLQAVIRCENCSHPLDSVFLSNTNGEPLYIGLHVCTICKQARISKEWAQEILDSFAKHSENGYDN